VPTKKTIGIVEVAFFAATTPTPIATITSPFGRRDRQPRRVHDRNDPRHNVVRMSFDRYVLSLDITGFTQSLTEPDPPPRWVRVRAAC
jgi:hypothetical protein